MISAVDTNVLVDVFKIDPVYGEASARLLRECINDGPVVACEVVWAELGALFPSREVLDENMGILGIGYSPVNRDAAHVAGQHWKRYIDRGGSRQRLITDFLVAGHAAVQCDRLITRDYGFYRDYFAELTVVSPS
ncbi:MAG: type II toxin-antitoxin system VapC family toxin [Candidatus Hydrogenedentes bacterium]|nr:type II toxin-antitoxin system VapC family toxin [Candidatus Hydrogenedentota bacterium]